MNHVSFSFIRGNIQNIKHNDFRLTKGVYPQSDVSLAMIDIDASKGFVDLWVTVILCDFCYFRSKKTTKIT